MRTRSLAVGCQSNKCSDNLSSVQPRLPKPSLLPRHAVRAKTASLAIAVSPLMNTRCFFPPTAIFSSPTTSRIRRNALLRLRFIFPQREAFPQPSSLLPAFPSSTACHVFAWPARPCLIPLPAPATSPHGQRAPCLVPLTTPATAPHDGFVPLPRSASRFGDVSARRVHASASLRFPLRRRLRTASAPLPVPIPAPATSSHGQRTFQNP